ncbi:MAG TPA: hypothetical protein VLX32_03460 [Candidatus Acidoferrum sp.]|nr:hypothetical protein [Candidatus Acidoferrum sp.]
MIRRAFHPTQPHAEPGSGRPSATGEEWLGHNRSEKRRLWERLNPRHRKLLRLLAEALALHQSQGRLSDQDRSRLSAVLTELEQLVGRIKSILQQIAKRPPFS